MTSTYFVKWSVANRMYRLLRGVTGSGPRKSTEIRSRGAPTNILPNGALGVLIGGLFAAQMSHFRSHI